MKKTKKLLWVLLFVLLWALLFVLSLTNSAMSQENNGNGIALLLQKNPEMPEIVCPVTLRKQCHECHTTPNNLIKEAPPDEQRVYPNSLIKVVDNKLYFDMDDVISSYLANKFIDAIHYMSWHPEVKHVIINIHSYGGSLFEAWRLIGYIDQLKYEGHTVETRTYGISASAAFLIFCAGSKGSRFIAETSQTMDHELRQYGSLLDLFVGKTPSDSEEQARIMKHLQDSINIWLATRGNLTEDELRDLTTKREFWMRGEDAIKYGFADGYIK